MADAFTPYSSAEALFGAKPSWIQDPLEIARIQSYQLYEQVYWNVPDTFKAQLRGTNDLTIYVPSGRVIVDATDQYAGVDIAFRMTDLTSGTETADTIAASMAVQTLMAREAFGMKYEGNKLYGIMRGDWLWHVTGNPLKPQGSRISIKAIDPAMYFPIPHEDDVDTIVGVHLAAQITTPNGPRIHRLTYRYLLDAEGFPLQPRTVTVEEAVFELTKWETPDGQPETIIQPPTALPPAITTIPVYHVPNTYEPGNPFGSSEMRGIERLMSAINQTISDEDLALALEGIGMYATDAPQPTDEEGNPVGWRLGPGRVVQTPEGSFFNRVSGVTSTGGYGEHHDRIWQWVKTVGRTPDVAVGRVDVSVAESGIALALQFLPMTAKVNKKNTIIEAIHTQMFFDIVNAWYPAYEATTFTNVQVNAVCGSAIPEDRAQRFAELTQMLADGVIDAQFYRDEATKLGYVFPADIQARVDASATKAAETQATALGADRLNQAANDVLPGGA